MRRTLHLLYALTLTLLTGCVRVDKSESERGQADPGESPTGSDTHSPVPSPTDSGSVPPTDTGPEEDEVDLVTLAAWQQLHTDLDPTPAHQPASIECDADAIRPEDGLLEIQTNDCNYALTGQPTQHDIQVGDTLDLLVYHSALSAAEPAEAHVLVSIGDQIVWEQDIPIPSTSQIYPVTATATAAAPIGTQVVLHLHNHGGNSWKLAHLRRRR